MAYTDSSSGSQRGRMVEALEHTPMQCRQAKTIGWPERVWRRNCDTSRHTYYYSTTCYSLTSTTYYRDVNVLGGRPVLVLATRPTWASTSTPSSASRHRKMAQSGRCMQMQPPLFTLLRLPRRLPDGPSSRARLFWHTSCCHRTSYVL